MELELPEFVHHSVGHHYYAHHYAQYHVIGCQHKAEREPGMVQGHQLCQSWDEQHRHGHGQVVAQQSHTAGNQGIPYRDVGQCVVVADKARPADGEHQQDEHEDV